MYKRCAEFTVLNPKPCRYKRCAESTLMLSGTNHECRQKQIDGLFWSVIIKFSKHNVLFTYEEYFGSRQHGMPGPVVLEKYCVYLRILIKFGFASFGKLRYFQSFVKAKVNTYFNIIRTRDLSEAWVSLYHVDCLVYHNDVSRKSRRSLIAVQFAQVLRQDHQIHQGTVANLV